MLTSGGSKILNDTHVVCVTPMWPYPPAKTQVILYDSSFGGEDIPTASMEPTTFEYQTVIEVVSPSIITVLGANLTFSGVGFSSSTTYICRFEFSGNHLDATATIMSFTELMCSAPALPSGLVAERVTIIFPLVSGSPQVLQDQLSVTYKPLWYGLGDCTGAKAGSCGNSSGPAAGNFSIQVLAVGLDPMKTYEVRFISAAGPSQTQISVQFNATGGDSHPVRLPEWEGPTGMASVTLHEMKGGEWLEIAFGEIAFGPAYQSGKTFTFKSNLISAASGPYPSVGCAGNCWPATISVVGAGFIPLLGDNQEYSCKLVAIDRNITVSSAATLVWPGTTQFQCVFGSAGLPSDYVAHEYTVFVMYQGVAINNLAAPITVVLRESWTDIVCAAGGCRGPASGNTVIRVVGFGFNASRDYYCDLGNVTSQKAHVVSTQYIECMTPIWTANPQEVDIRVLDENGERLSYEGDASRIHRFQYLASWWLPPAIQYASVYGPSHGGRQVDDILISSNFTVAGIGFKYGIQTNVTYFAELTGLDYGGNNLQGQTKSVKALSDTEIRIPLIAWYGPQGLLDVQLFQCDSHMVCVPVNVDPGASLAHPSKNVYKTIKVLASMAQVYVGKLGDALYENMCHPFGPVRCWGSAHGGMVVKVVGDGFEPRSTAYACRFMNASNPSSYIDSGAAAVLNPKEILCLTPVWPHGAGLVTIHTIYNTTRLPQHVDRNNTQFYFSASFSRSVLESGSASDDTVLLEGVSLQGTADSFDCHFSADDRSGFPWLADYTVKVGAVSTSSTQVACNITGQWGAQYPATTSHVRLLWKTAPVSLQFDMSETVVELKFNASNHRMAEFRALYMEVGTYIMVDEEVMLVTHVPNDYSVVVARAQRSSVSAPHLLGAQIQVLLPVASNHHPNYIFQPAYKSIDVHRSLASGGRVLTAEISGLAANYLEYTTTLDAYQQLGNVSGPPIPRQFKANPIDTGDDTGLQYWGVGFDIFVRRSLRVSEIDFTALIDGKQKVWIYKRDKSTCSGSLCGMWGYELLRDSWELVGKTDTNASQVLGMAAGFDITVDSSLRFTVAIDQVPIAAGETLGFLIVADKGIRFANSDQPGYECVSGAVQRCKQWSDQFASIQPGKIILTHAIHPSIYPNAFVDAKGQVTDPFFFMQERSPILTTK